jgi:hypothetical protein
MEMTEAVIEGIRDAQINRRYGTPDMRPRQNVQYNITVEQVDVQDEHVNLAIHLTIPTATA